ncbi:hypothetical protein CVT25_004794, partial [Psilocybe cyanescens]
MAPNASKNTATVPNSPPKTRRSTRKWARVASAVDPSAAPPAKMVAVGDEEEETDGEIGEGESVGIKGKPVKQNKAASAVDASAAPPAKKVAVGDEEEETDGEIGEGESVGIKGKPVKQNKKYAAKRGNVTESVLKDSGVAKAPPPTPVKEKILASSIAANLTLTENTAVQKPFTCQCVSKVQEEEVKSEDMEEEPDKVNEKDKGKGKARAISD